MSKRTIQELAVFGGTPAFDGPVHVGAPNIADRARFLERVNDILDRRWLSNNGPYVREFEKQVAARVGTKHCVATCNGTLALEIAARAMGLAGEVIVPSFTFVATAHALQWQEITPVFADVEPTNFNLDPASAERMITPRTTGMVGVHLWGRPCDTDRLEDLARRKNLKLLFDASHAFGCTHRGRPVGGFGHAEVFSFHATKFLNAVEGGAIVTNDDALAARCRQMTNFGFVQYDQVDQVGTNGKMNEMSAAMGLTNLEAMDDFIAANRRNYLCYAEALSRIPGLTFHTFDDAERNNYQYVSIEVDEAITGLSRDDLVRVLHAEKVLVRRYFHPGCHRMEPYKSYFPHAGLLLPVTERLSERVVCFPTGTAITPAGIAEVCRLMTLICANGRAIKETLRQRGDVLPTIPPTPAPMPVRTLSALAGVA
jgi:dTDP-4-amino-4,6-dideoxygalactose transaminase